MRLPIALLSIMTIILINNFEYFMLLLSKRFIYHETYTLGNSCHIRQVGKVTVDLLRLAGLSTEFPADRPAIYGMSTVS